MQTGEEVYSENVLKMVPRAGKIALVSKGEACVKKVAPYVSIGNFS